MDTHGLDRRMAVARIRATQRLGRLFHDGLVDKEYLALVEGHPRDDAFDVDAPIAEGTELTLEGHAWGGQYAGPCR